MIKYQRIRFEHDDYYEVYDGTKYIGELSQREDDEGYFHYFPAEGLHRLSYKTLVSITKKVKELNTEFDKEVSRLLTMLEEARDGDDFIGHRG